MVALQLQCGKECRHGGATQIFAAIAPHDTSYRRRDIGEDEQFPDVSRADKNEEITREGIGYGAQYRIVPPHLERKHQQEEAHHQHKQPTHRRGEAQLIEITDGGKPLGALVGGSDLERGHTAKQGVGP